MKLLVLLTCLILSLHSNVLSQTMPSNCGILLKDIDISTSFDQNGKISKITIKPNNIDEKLKYPIPIDRKYFDDILEIIVPTASRGEKLGESKSSVGRALGTSVIYQNVKITLTIVYQNGYRVSYAEIFPRNGKGIDWERILQSCDSTVK